jgi:hypothetical protein
MPFTTHPEFVPPPKPDSLVWRYTDLAKFLSLLDRSALYFPRVDTLDDPFEGLYTKSSAAVEELTFEEWKLRSNIDDEGTYKGFVGMQRNVRQFSKLQREITFVNSWYCQEHESAAMWSSYLKTQEGIAIQSTYQRLTEAFANYAEYEIFIGMVSYMEYDCQAISGGNILLPLMSKRKSFEHEHELRAVIWTMQHGKNEWGAANKLKEVKGIYVPAALERLIERVYVAPTAPDWVRELLESLVRRFGLSAPVQKSSLAEAPFY